MLIVVLMETIYFLFDFQRAGCTILLIVDFVHFSNKNVVKEHRFTFTYKPQVLLSFMMRACYTTRLVVLLEFLCNCSNAVVVIIF